MVYKDLDLGYVYGLPMSIVEADSYVCAHYNDCFPEEEIECNSD